MGALLALLPALAGTLRDPDVMAAAAAGVEAAVDADVDMGVETGVDVLLASGLPALSVAWARRSAELPPVETGVDAGVGESVDAGVGADVHSAEALCIVAACFPPPSSGFPPPPGGGGVLAAGEASALTAALRHQ
eukprot:228836-Chlamydomonas_euryale.AAC.1